jgi:tetratricopeptide (TPR) repeat protein
MNLGIAHRNQGQLPLAIEQYRSALAIDPEHADSHSNIGVALFQLARPNEAVHHYSLAVQFEPNHHDALNNLANAYQAGERYDEAGVAYRKAIDVKPRRTADYAILLSNYGNMLHASEQYEQAVAVWKRALALNPKQLSAVTLFRLADAGMQRADRNSIRSIVELYFMALASDNSLAEAKDRLMDIADNFLGRHGEQQHASEELLNAARLLEQLMLADSADTVIAAEATKFLYAHRTLTTIQPPETSTDSPVHLSSVLAKLRLARRALELALKGSG